MSLGCVFDSPDILSGENEFFFDSVNFYQEMSGCVVMLLLPVS